MPKCCKCDDKAIAKAVITIPRWSGEPAIELTPAPVVCGKHLGRDEGDYLPPRDLKELNARYEMDLDLGGTTTHIEYL